MAGYYDEYTGEWIEDPSGGLTGPLDDTSGTGGLPGWSYLNGVWTDPEGTPFDMRYLGSGTTPSGLASIANLLKGTSSFGTAGQIAGLAGLGGMLGLLKNSKPPGYRGRIPELTATRSQIEQPVPAAGAPARRPGSAGRRYFTDVTYAPTATTPTPTPTPAPTNPPAEQASTGGKATAQGANTNTNTNTASPTYTHPSTLVAGSPGSEYQPFEGWSEYFDPTGAYRRFSSTGTPITPMKFGTSAGNIAGQAVSPYSVPYSVLGFTPDKAGYDARLAADQAAVKKAEGGLLELARGGRAMPPRYLRGDTDGMADKIPSSIDNRQPAKLSHGEFVIPADVVAHFGNGNSDAGAKFLYKMMDRIRQARTGTKKQGKRINPAKFMPGGIAGYAEGGAVAFDAGGLAGDVSVESNLSAYIGPYVSDYLGKGKALAATPYEAYTGPLTAGESGLQSKVFSGLQGLSFPGQLGQTFSSTGAYQLPTAGGPATGPGGIASQYMNPYLQAVLTPQLEEMRRQADISRKNLGAKFGGAGGAGAFSGMGGGRHAIESAELERNLMQEQNKAIGQGYASAYDRAMGQFNTEQGQAKTLADMMAGAGKAQRDIESEGIAADRAQFEEERLFPYKQLQFQQGLIQGLPVSTQTTSEATTGLGQLSGTLGGLVGLAEQIKKLFPTG